MPTYAGPWWFNGAATDGWVRVEDGRVVEEAEGNPDGDARPSIILEGLVNYHSHVGDAFLRGHDLPKTVEALVAPGTGYKHRMLAQAKDQEIRQGIQRVLSDYRAHGIIETIDFREQGAPGLRVAREAAEEEPRVRLRLLGRPADLPPSPSELAELLDWSDGAGIPSLSDYGIESCDRIRLAFRSRRLPVAIHASEARREDIDAILSLEPDLLIHLCSATPEDLKRVARAKVPIVLCPTSNRFFGLSTPIEEAERLGIPWYLGTDNAMLGSVDLVEEARRLLEAMPTLGDEAILRALTTHPAKAIKRARPLEGDDGVEAPLIILPLDDADRVQWGTQPLILER